MYSSDESLVLQCQLEHSVDVRTHPSGRMQFQLAAFHDIQYRSLTGNSSRSFHFLHFSFSINTLPTSSSRLLTRRLGPLPLRSPPPLLNNHLLPRMQHLQLSIFNALQPVSERSPYSRENRVYPQTAALKERSHFYAELNKTGRDAWRAWIS